MSEPKRIIRRLRSVLFRRRLEQELDEELQFHLERQIEANIKQGMAPGEARTAALRLFGGVEQTKEACREAHGIGGPSLDARAHDHQAPSGTQQE